MNLIGLETLDCIAIIYNLKTSIPRVTIKTRYPHHPSHTLESVALIKRLQNWSVKLLITHHEKRDNMVALPPLLSTLNIEETKKNLCRKIVGRKIVICTELCTTNYITYMHTYKTGLDQLVK